MAEKPSTELVKKLKKIEEQRSADFSNNKDKKIYRKKLLSTIWNKITSLWGF